MAKKEKKESETSLLMAYPNKLDEIVYVTCYRKRKQYTRRKALKFFYEAIQGSDGSERERYETIFFQLLEGCIECSDEE